MKATGLWLAMLIAAPPLSAHFGDSESFPAAAEILSWNPQQQLQGYRSYADIFPTRAIKAAAPVYPLVPGSKDFSKVAYKVDGKRYGLNDYMRINRVAGIIAVHQGRVLYERYELGNSAATPWVSYSVAKSVVSLLYGAAIQDGYIASVDDPVVKYLPRLAGGAYDKVTIKQLLQMSSGVAWNEDYVDPTADVSQSPTEILALIDYMRALPTAAAPGEEFNYSTGETNLAGAVLRAAVGNNLATYLTHKIWQPFGMQADGNWMLGAPGGVEWGGCCISATLRDYARLGLFALGDGKAVDGSRIVPEGWIEESTSPASTYEGYGYFWWLRPNGAFAAVGIYGQLIWVDPASQTVIAMHSAWPNATGDPQNSHRWAFVDALAAAIVKSGG